MIRHASSSRRPKLRILPAAAIAMIGVVCAPLAVAQTRFVWPTAALDLERYTTVEECLAATARLRDSTANRSDVWRDTLPAAPDDASIPLPAPVAATAQRCGRRFLSDTAPLKDFALLLRLALQAGSDSNAGVLVHRRLAAIPAKADSQRAAVLDSVADQYLSAQPARLELAAPIVEQLVKSNAFSSAARVNRLVALFSAARNAGDTALASRVARQALGVLEKATEAEKRSPEFERMHWNAFGALAWLGRTAAMDSLRQGTAGYVALARKAWVMASGESPEALKIPIGERAPFIEGEFWFGDGTQAASTAGHPRRPTPGRISLVAFSPEPCVQGFADCWEEYAVLRRLAQRFPAVEITVVARTRGHFERLKPPTPAEEAEVKRKLWKEYHHVPGIYVVKETAFWRLPGLDRRRIDRDDPNQINYSFGDAFSFAVFLVDEDGIIVHKDRMARETEADFAERIDVLLRRNEKGA